MPVVLIKAIDVWPVFHRLGKVDLIPVLGPIPSQMPFPDHRGMITRSLQQMPKRRTIRRNQMRTPSAQHAPRKAGPPVITSGQQTVTRRGAHRARRMRIEESHPLLCHLLQMRRLNFALQISRRNITNAQIISHHQNDIRLLRRPTPSGCQKQPHPKNRFHHGP